MNEEFDHVGSALHRMGRAGGGEINVTQHIVQLVTDFINHMHEVNRLPPEAVTEEHYNKAQDLIGKLQDQGIDPQALIDQMMQRAGKGPGMPVTEHAEGGRISAQEGGTLSDLITGHKPGTIDPRPDYQSSLGDLKNYMLRLHDQQAAAPYETDDPKQAALHEFYNRPENRDVGARLVTSAATPFYGTDREGNIVLGGRAWTHEQGGTPMDLLDRITSIPHALAGLADKLMGPTPVSAAPKGYTPEQAEAWSKEKLADMPLLAGSKQAGERSEAFQDKVARSLALGPAKTFAQHLAEQGDAVIPVPGLKAEGAAGHLAGFLGASGLRGLPRMLAEWGGIQGATDWATGTSRGAAGGGGGGSMEPEDIVRSASQRGAGPPNTGPPEDSSIGKDIQHEIGEEAYQRSRHPEMATRDFARDMGIAPQGAGGMQEGGQPDPWAATRARLRILQHPTIEGKPGPSNLPPAEISEGPEYDDDQMGAEAIANSLVQPQPFSEAYRDLMKEYLDAHGTLKGMGDPFGRPTSDDIKLLRAHGALEEQLAKLKARAGIDEEEDEDTRPAMADGGQPPQQEQPEAPKEDDLLNDMLQRRILMRQSAPPLPSAVPMPSLLAGGGEVGFVERLMQLWEKLKGGAEHAMDPEAEYAHVQQQAQALHSAPHDLSDPDFQAKADAYHQRLLQLSEQLNPKPDIDYSSLVKPQEGFPTGGKVEKDVDVSDPGWTDIRRRLAILQNPLIVGKPPSLIPELPKTVSSADAVNRARMQQQQMTEMSQAASPYDMMTQDMLHQMYGTGRMTHADLQDYMEMLRAKIATGKPLYPEGKDPYAGASREVPQGKVTVEPVEEKADETDATGMAGGGKVSLELLKALMESGRLAPEKLAELEKTIMGRAGEAKPGDVPAKRTEGPGGLSYNEPLGPSEHTLGVMEREEADERRIAEMESQGFTWDKENKEWVRPVQGPEEGTKKPWWEGLEKAYPPEMDIPGGHKGTYELGQRPEEDVLAEIQRSFDALRRREKFSKESLTNLGQKLEGTENVYKFPTPRGTDDLFNQTRREPIPDVSPDEGHDWSTPMDASDRLEAEFAKKGDDNPFKEHILGQAEFLRKHLVKGPSSIEIPEENLLAHIENNPELARYHIMDNDAHREYPSWAISDLLNMNPNFSKFAAQNGLGHDPVRQVLHYDPDRAHNVLDEAERIQGESEDPHGGMPTWQKYELGYDEDVDYNGSQVAQMISTLQHFYDYAHTSGKGFAGGGSTRRGFLGKLAALAGVAGAAGKMIPERLSELEKSIIGASKEEAPQMTKELTKDDIQRRLQGFKNDFYGGSDVGSHELQGAMDYYLKDIPGNQKVVERAKDYHDFLTDLEKGGEGTWADPEREEWAHANALQHAVDELGTHYGIPRIPDPNWDPHLHEGRAPGSTPILDEMIEPGQGDVQAPYEGHQGMIDFRNLVRQHLAATGHTEEGLLSDWWLHPHDQPHLLHHLAEGIEGPGSTEDSEILDGLLTHLEES